MIYSPFEFFEEESSIRLSKSGYEFDLNGPVWKLDPSEVIYFRLLPCYIAYDVKSGMVLTLARMAEELSPAYVKNCYYSFVSYFIKTPHYTGGKISGIQIINLNAGLTEENEYKLGVIRGFLRNWIDWGYPGIHKDLERTLNSLTLRGCVKGRAVLHSCPYTGHFTITEQQALLVWAANAFIDDTLTLREYAWFYLCYATARRPIQLSSLRIKDLRIEVSGDEKKYSIDIPRAKRRGEERGFRKAFRRLSVTADLFMVLTNLAEEVKKIASGYVVKLSEKDFMDLPLFIINKWPEEVHDVLSLRKMQREKPQDIHLTRASVGKISRQISRKCNAVSERTGEYIHFTPIRCRRTRATNLVRHGITGVQLAFLLDHDDTQNINVYTGYTPELALRIFDKMDEAMNFLALKFEGRLIAKESEAIRSNDASSRVHKKNFEHVGNCGGSPYCESGIKTCVVCARFQPLLNAPWDELLNDMFSELEERKKQGASDLVIKSYDLSIMHIGAIIRACNKKNEI